LATRAGLLVRSVQR